MKTPSKNIPASLRGQSPGGRAAQAPMVSKPRAMGSADMMLPGEGGVENPPGMPPERSSKPFAGAVGGHFGGGR